jgi:hypothetical protein
VKKPKATAKMPSAEEISEALYAAASDELQEWMREHVRYHRRNSFGIPLADVIERARRVAMRPVYTVDYILKNGVVANDYPDAAAVAEAAAKVLGTAYHHGNTFEDTSGRPVTVTLHIPKNGGPLTLDFQDVNGSTTGFYSVDAAHFKEFIRRWWSQASQESTGDAYTVREQNNASRGGKYVGNFNSKQSAIEFAEQQARKSQPFMVYTVFTGSREYPGSDTGVSFTGGPNLTPSQAYALADSAILSLRDAIENDASRKKLSNLYDAARAAVGVYRQTAGAKKNEINELDNLLKRLSRDLA